MFMYIQILLIQELRADPVLIISQSPTETLIFPVRTGLEPAGTETGADTFSTVTDEEGTTTVADVGVVTGVVTVDVVESVLDESATGVSVTTGVSVETESFFWQAVARPARRVSESRKRILLVLCLIKPA
jgi:hypothetical protein